MIAPRGSWTFFWLLTAVVFAVILPSMPAGSGPETGMLRIAVVADLDSLDPAQMTTTSVGNLLDYIVETLTTIDAQGNIRPLLAESWQVSSDGLQYTFKLRPGVAFHDGTPFNAQAVKWNLDRLKDRGVRVPIRAPYPILDVNAVDDSTVNVTLVYPLGSFISALSWTTAAMISPASAVKHGNGYTNIVHPMGTGPYVFKEHKKSDSMTVTRYDKYWGRKPHYDTVVFRVVPDAATRERLLLGGEVELMVRPPAGDLPALSRNSGVKVLLAPSGRTVRVVMNTTKPPLSDPRVRQALNHAVDKSAIIQSVHFGAADPVDAPVAPSVFGYCKVGAYEFNQAKAKQLLAEAGIKPGTKITFIHTTGVYPQDTETAPAIASYLRAVGLEPELQAMDWPKFYQAMMTPAQSNVTHLHLLGWAPAFLDAAQEMLQFLSAYAPPSGMATSFYKDPEVDQLVIAAQREVNADKRREQYCQISKKVWADAPWIFLWVPRYPIVYSAKIRDVGATPNEKFSTVYARPVQ